MNLLSKSKENSIVACLDMYRWAETAPVFDMLWESVQKSLNDAGFDAPQFLTEQGEDLRSFAANKTLLLGHICGITYARTHRQKPHFTPLGAFISEDDTLNAGQYCSILVMPTDASFDPLNVGEYVAAVNSYDSFSGWVLLAQHFNDQQTGKQAIFSEQVEESLFADEIISGSHRKSAEMVARKEADIAAIDNVCWGLLRRFDSDIVAELKVVGRTLAYPAPPLVTSCHHSEDLIATLKESLRLAMTESVIASAMASIGIMGIAQNSDEDYEALE